MIMADKIPLLDRFIDLLNYTWHNYTDLLNDTWHNYERPVQRGFNCSDTSIRYPYSPDDTVSIPVLLFMVVVPFVVVTLHGIINYWMLNRDFTFQLPRPMGMVGGALLTALLTAGIKLYAGRLAPNFYEGCQPYVVDSFDNLLNYTWHNYERPVQRGFNCPDTSIRYPYSPDDTVSIPVLLFMVVVPFLVMTCHRMLKRHSIFQLPRPMGMVVGALLVTALLTACIKLYIGRLAPNFYEGCQPYVEHSGTLKDLKALSFKDVVLASSAYVTSMITGDAGRRCCDDNLTYHAAFNCTYPERLREVSRSFPCMYTSLAYFSWSYLSIYCVYAWSASRYTLAVIFATFFAPPTTIALTRLHDNKSHLGNVIAGCMLGIFIAAVFTIGTASGEESIQIYSVYEWSASRYTLAVIVVTFLSPPTTIALTRLHDNRSHLEDVIAGCMLGILIAAVFAIGTASRGKSIGKTTEKVKGKPLKPTVRVCSSALQSNVEGFVKEVDDLLYGFIECVEFSELPYNDLDAFTLDGWDKNDVIILCHSIDNRRLSLTDVTDALYDNFIPKVSKFCGKESLIVIAHDFRWKGDQAKARQALETTLHAKQPTAYEYAGNVILAGKLGEEKTYDGLWDQDWDVIRDVIYNWCKMKN